MNLKMLEYQHCKVAPVVNWPHRGEPHNVTDEEQIVEVHPKDSKTSCTEFAK